MPRTFGLSDASIAKLLLLALSFCWGLSWSAMRIALDEVSPWGMRLIGFSIGAATLLVLIKAQGRSLVIPRGRDRLHVIVAAFFIVVAFGVAGTFAQLMANTSRVIIVNYSMPVWSSVMAYFVLGERINRQAAIGLALCIAGLVVLVYPVAEQSVREPVGLLLALVCALGWGGGTVYMKWARIKGDLLAISFWQVVVGVVIFGIAYLVFNGLPHYEPLHWRTWGGLLFNGVLGTGIAYFIWFNIIGRLTTVMASLGSLINPVVGVFGAMILLGDRPTLSDAIGFALIFGAAACVMIPSRQKPPAEGDSV
ncbi:putative permease, DMT superfamily [Rhodoplanes sp. Z2-YC6860]|nr:putative permease, DMT superfamily [Rhodoplanes sp. Z2-YC6860]